MGKQVVLTDLEWEYLQALTRESLLNLSEDVSISPNLLPSRAEVTRDNLGEFIWARLIGATTVAEPGAPTITVPGEPAPTGPETTNGSTPASQPPAFY